MNLFILLEIQKWSIPFLDFIFKCFTNLGSETFYILFISYLYWFHSKNIGLRLFFILAISTYFNICIKEWVQYPRPFLNPKIHARYISSATGFSFPSGHTQASVTFWFSLFLENKKWKTISILMIFFIAFSRIYLCVHWPTDVLGGILIGYSLVFMFYKNLNFFYFLIFRFERIVIFILLLLILNPYDENMKILLCLLGGILGYFLEKKFLHFKSTFEKNKNQFFQVLIVTFLFLSLNLILNFLRYILPYEIYIYKYFLIGFLITFIIPYTITYIKKKATK